MSASTVRTTAISGLPVASSDARQLALSVLGGSCVVLDGSQSIAVPEGCKRLLVFVSLHDGHVDRRYAAGTLWPEGDDERAAGNLRSALWRLRGAGVQIVHADKCALWLDPDVRFDLRVVDAWAGRILAGETHAEDLNMPERCPEAAEILPGWYDDWVIFERERLRQRVFHATEALSRMLVAAHCYAQAIEVALTATFLEPLRESSQRALVEAHLAEGNLVEARRIFCSYRELVQRELGVEPSAALAHLVGVHLATG